MFPRTFLHNKFRKSEKYMYRAPMINIKKCVFPWFIFRFSHFSGKPGKYIFHLHDFTLTCSCPENRSSAKYAGVYVAVIVRRKGRNNRILFLSYAGIPRFHVPSLEERTRQSAAGPLYIYTCTFPLSFHEIKEA